MFKIEVLIIANNGHMTINGRAAFHKIAPPYSGCALFFGQRKVGFCEIFSGIGELFEDIAVSDFDG